MRMELRCEPGPDGPEVWACVDGVAFARARQSGDDGVDIGGGGYHVNRDLLPPELEPAVRELEYQAGARVLELGESLGCDVSRPTDAQVDAARRGTPPHRPDPQRVTVKIGNLTVTAPIAAPVAADT